MLVPDHPFQVALVLAVALCAAAVGGALAVLLRQPRVIGEIVIGLVAGPFLLAALGSGTYHRILPASVLQGLQHVAEAGVVLFIMTVTHEVRAGPRRPDGRSVGFLVGGSLLPPAVCGLALGAWVLDDAEPLVRGDAPAASLLLFLAVAMGVTAVPVLARILAERHMLDSLPGRLAMASAMVTDSVAWLLLAVAVGLRSGTAGAFWRSVVVITVGLAVSLLARRVLARRRVTRWTGAHPAVAVVLVTIATLVVSQTVKDLGMTSILGAVLVGMALPVDAAGAWTRPSETVRRWAKVLMPAFFVATGVSLFTRPLGGTLWPLVVAAVLLGAVGKLTGGYLGGRLGRQGHLDSLRVAACVNTRGLTELVFLQAGFAAGIITAPLFFALVMMALLTTASTGPLLSLLDRLDRLDRLEAAPARVPAEVAAR